jgi:phosphoribosylformimino-5-aminoimidazole carboxamide ribonucleotide (ProFAR) isomerase
MTTVTIDIEAHEEGSVVRLVEGIYEDDEIGNQDMLNRASGWAQALTLMKFWVEHGVKY